MELPASVSALLADLIKQLRPVLREQLVGVYLFGSLATGAFDDASDIDVLVVTSDKLSNDTFDSLAEMHRHFADPDSYWHTQLEVSYIPLNALRCYDLNDRVHPHLNRNKGERLELMPHNSDWVLQRHVLRKQGVRLLGPDIATLIDPVSPAEMKHAMAPLIKEWAADISANPAQLERHAGQSYTVLTMCRILYTLATGDVASKPQAVEWVSRELDPKWRGLIERAWVNRHTPKDPADLNDIAATIELVDYVVRQT